MRLNVTSRIWLIELTMSVLARPGTPTSRQWPRVKMAARICSMTSVWPTMARRSCSIICVRAWLNWARYSLILSGVTGGLSVMGERARLGRVHYTARLRVSGSAGAAANPQAGTRSGPRRGAPSRLLPY